MSGEKFLAFRGLKQYDPSAGWAEVHKLDGKASIEAFEIDPELFADTAERPPESAARPSQGFAALTDPLLNELFEQLHQPPQDELTQNWKHIAASVNVLSQRMSEQRELRERLQVLDLELNTLRQDILHDLQDIQRAADQQLTVRLRAEVSALAQARLATRLRDNKA